MDDTERLAHAALGYLAHKLGGSISLNAQDFMLFMEGTDRKSLAIEKPDEDHTDYRFYLVDRV